MLRIALTPGEPAGVGPDLTVALAQRPRDYALLAFADPQLLQQRAQQLGLPLELQQVTAETAEITQAAGTLAVVPHRLASDVEAGRLDPANSAYVVETLNSAIDACRAEQCDALVTGPVHKGVINDAGVPFTGHTELLAERTDAEQVVMMLAVPELRVALATTHLPLREVADAITPSLLERVVRTLHATLQRDFGLQSPNILVCGLNPHAGEGGHLGREELEVIEPLLERLRGEGMALEGPLPADTLFTPPNLQRADAVLAMYHDQGLPVLKHLGFGRAVNVTLGLPIIRTSVDHGTALDLAGSGRADGGSLDYALSVALQMAAHRRGSTHE